MKYALPAIGLTFAMMMGCASKKPAPTTSVTDLTAPSITTPAAPLTYGIAAPTPITTPDPMISTPPMATVTPTISASMTTGSSYVVKPGDTLWKISAAHYGNGKKYRQIIAANPGLTPQKLKVGQTITLP